jgi:hypothetical protein
LCLKHFWSVWSNIKRTFNSSFYVVSGFSVEHAIESFIMDVVVNSGSEYITKRGNLFYEDIDNPF